MDYGAFGLFGCVALALLFYIPFGVFAYFRKSSRIRFHIISVAALSVFLLGWGLFVRQMYLLNEPLASAAQGGDLKTVRLLLDEGASPNAEGVDGITTALVGAAANGQREVVRVLLAKGADVNQPDSQGRTALQRATQEGHKDIIQILKMAGATEMSSCNEKASYNTVHPSPKT